MNLEVDSKHQVMHI